MAEEEVVNYLVSDHQNIFGIHILFADWWWQYSDEEFKAAAAEHERVLRHIAKHGTPPKDMDPKLRQAGIPNFLTNAVLPVLESVFPKSLKVDMVPFKIPLSNGKVLRSVVHALTLAQISSMAALLKTFIEIKVNFLNLTHMKEFDMSSDMLDGLELLKTIARKGQCVVEVWWNNKNGRRQVIMPDGEVCTVSKDFTSTEFKTTRVETVIAEHYEEMMLHFSISGTTEETNPSML